MGIFAQITLPVTFHESIFLHSSIFLTTTFEKTKNIVLIMSNQMSNMKILCLNSQTLWSVDGPLTTTFCPHKCQLCPLSNI